jgi:nitroimidazol reductase NimA-like FMN-containing flavoprotein (pyridoxamine 5'-phosphate oxidase superfamily)
MSQNQQHPPNPSISPGELPHFPSGYIPPEGGKVKLEWSFIQSSMRQAKNYWIVTATLQGKPSATPVWGVWVDDRLYFDGSPETRRGRNIAANPQTAVHLESGDQAVMLEGTTVILPAAPERALAERIAAGYREKYAELGYAPQPDQWDAGGLFEFTPNKVIAWTSFVKDPTRWILKP